MDNNKQHSTTNTQHTPSILDRFGVGSTQFVSFSFLWESAFWESAIFLYFHIYFRKIVLNKCSVTSSAAHVYSSKPTFIFFLGVLSINSRKARFIAISSCRYIPHDGAAPLGQPPYLCSVVHIHCCELSFSLSLVSLCCCCCPCLAVYFKAACPYFSTRFQLYNFMSSCLCGYRSLMFKETRVGSVLLFFVYFYVAALR